MRPRHIAYIIWIVIALLGVVCLVVPDGGWHIGTWNLRFPTLAEALDLDMQKEESGILNDSLLAELDTMDQLPMDSLVQLDTTSTIDTPQQKTPLAIPYSHRGAGLGGRFHSCR